VLKNIEKKIDYVETSDLGAVLKELDVLYVTRVQKERFTDPTEYEKVKDAYVIDRALLRKGKRDLVVMHPLPRVTEVSTDVDSMPQAWYFKQMRHGVYVRMALLALILGAT